MIIHLCIVLCAIVESGRIRCTYIYIYIWNYLNTYKAWIANIQVHYKRKHSHYWNTSMNKLKQESLVRKYLLKIMDLESTYIDGLWCIYISIAIWHWEVSKRDGESNQTELFGNLTGNTFISIGGFKTKGRNKIQNEEVESFMGGAK